MSSISHEFRTPLNGIIGLSEALMNNACGVLDDKVHHQLHIIRTSGLRLLALDGAEDARAGEVGRMQAVR